MNKSVPGIKNSVQNDINWSFDEDFGVLAVEGLVYNPATGTMDRAVQSGGANVGFNTNHLDDTTTTNVVYICQEDASGTWRIKKIDSTGTFPVFTWASVLNNPSVTTYTAAYTARATTLVYSLYSLAF